MIKLNSQKNNISLKLLDDPSVALELYVYILNNVFALDTQTAFKLGCDLKSSGSAIIDDYEFQSLMGKISDSSDFMENFGLSFNYQLSHIK